jgi:hypothetical protein
MHTVTAFFDSRDHAEMALARLRDYGITDTDLTVSPDAGPTQTETTQEPETGFWAFLKEVFGAAPEYPSYREGLRRGGIMIVAHVDEARLERACDILDEHGSVDLDEREQQWRQEGWAHEPATPSQAAQTYSSDLGGGAAFGAGEPASGATPSEPMAQPPTTPDDQIARSVNRGRVRIHNFDSRTPVQDRVAAPEESMGSETFGERIGEAFAGGAHVGETGGAAMGDWTGSQSGGAEQGFTGRLAEDMEVLGADGQHVGVIDHIEGASIELKKDDPAAHGQHHFIPMDWIASVDQAARLKLSAADAWSRWTAH